MRKALWGLVILVMISSACAERREPTAPIGWSCLQGSVIGNDGAVPGAEVTIWGPNLPRARSTTTDSAGVYRLCDLPSGKGYQVTVRVPGFQIQVRLDLELVPGATQNLPFRLYAEGTGLILWDPSPTMDPRDTSVGATVVINPRTGEPEPHPR